jgi:hypothetical protein
VLVNRYSLRDIKNISFMVLIVMDGQKKFIYDVSCLDRSIRKNDF